MSVQTFPGRAQAKHIGAWIRTKNEQASSEGRKRSIKSWCVKKPGEQTGGSHGENHWKVEKNLSWLSLTNLRRMAVDKSERRERILESRSTVQMQQPRSPLDVRNWLSRNQGGQEYHSHDAESSRLSSDYIRTPQVEIVLLFRVHGRMIPIENRRRFNSSRFANW